VSDYSALEWLARSALGGGLVLLVAWWGMRRVESPARRQRLGEAGVAAALLVAVLSLAPGWIGVRLPTFANAPAAPPAPVDSEPPPAAGGEADIGFDLVDLEPPVDIEPMPVEEVPPLVAAAATPAAASFDWAGVGRLLVAGYAVAAGGMLAWWLGGHVVLWWWLRRAGPIPPRLERLWTEMAAGRAVRLVVSPRVRVPFSCGLWRPTVVLPASLAGSATEAALRWVLGHELAHLERRDPYSAVLFGLAQGLYFFLPWFWKLRHEVRLCQEYLADQAAVEAGDDRVAYADFLVGWAQRPGLPAGVPGVAGGRTDLFRRIAMLLQDKVSLEPRCPRCWLVLPLSGLLSLAVLLSGLGPARSKASADDPKGPDKGVTKQEDKKEKPAAPKDDKGKDTKKDKSRTTFPDIEDLMKRLPVEVDEGQLRMIRQQLEQARRQFEQAMQQAARAWPRERFSGWVRGTAHERLGVGVAAPSPILAEQLDLPKGQGVVIEAVRPGSPAAKAGLKRHDVLLELAGKPVPSQPDRLARLVRDLEPEKKVEAVVLRKGKKETIKDLVLPKPPEQPARARGARIGRSGGADLMLSLQRTGDQFTISQRDGARSITIRGKLVDGKAQTESIVVSEGRGRRGESYESVDKVPAGVRDQVKSLIEMAEKGVVTSKPKKN
jgi:hypothetical protein